ncbi:glycosyltransferase [Novosphingobium sp. RD2P27]|uniref:Glycosyltransferase n=1 Tax=Novosphingobium kalidii TaxID=3230299 RepID=A0ABV2D031_9SPHN
MIFLTVGTQLPFDRLIKAVDSLAPSLDQPVFAQTGSGAYEPQNMEWRARLEPARFSQLVRDAAVLVSHAGIGTILMARKHGKPVILYPRRAALNEHRSDHQLATTAALGQHPGIYVANTDEELAELLHARLQPPPPIVASPQLIRLRDHLAQFIGGAG